MWKLEAARWGFVGAEELDQLFLAFLLDILDARARTLMVIVVASQEANVAAEAPFENPSVAFEVCACGRGARCIRREVRELACRAIEDPWQTGELRDAIILHFAFLPHLER